VINEKYSFKDYTNQLKNNPGIDLTDANGTTIQGTNFHQDAFPFVDMAAMGLTNITFVDCDLDNIIVPESCTMKGCCNRYLRQKFNEETQEYEYWLCDVDGNYLEVFNG